MVCRKTGKIVGLNRNCRWSRWFFPLLGALALTWYPARVVPKPSRANYPCQRVAAPTALGGLSCFLSMFGLATAFRKMRGHLRQHRYFVPNGTLVIDNSGGLTKAEGKGLWWVWPDPHDLYAQDHPRSKNDFKLWDIITLWNWSSDLGIVFKITPKD